MDGLGNNLLANSLLALAYALYKVVDRCMHSKCNYTRDKGLVFSLDDDDKDPCPLTDMQKIADLLKSRATVHKHFRMDSTRAPPPPPGPSLPGGQV